MLRRNFVVVCLISLVASMGYAGVPDHAASTASTLAAGELVSVFTNVDGTANPINDARTATSAIDATITVTVIDTFANPIFQYPFEDIWLETAAGGLLLCNGGSVADASTDINGQTTFSGTLFAGGCSFYDLTTNEQTVVIIDGDPITSAGSALDIIFNTADLSGDLLVGVQDTALFKPLYIGGTTGTMDYAIDFLYQVDFYFDEQITLSDLVLYAGVANTACP